MRYINQSKLLFLGAASMAVSGPAFAQSGSEEPADEMVQVAYRQIPKKDLLGGISTINVEELTQKNYNTYSMDNLQGYVGGWNGNSLWGMDSYIAIIDGVPRDLNNIKPDEIESISFMKGAQAAVLYGSRAAKGAIVVTTRRGKEGDLKVEARVNTGWNVAKAFPEYVGAAEYMTLYNEALANDGLSAKYSDWDRYNTSIGANPYRYPDVNFYSSDYVKKSFNRTDATVELSGGSERAKYYSNVSYYTNGDYMNFAESENNRTQRLNVRGNVDFRLSDIITAFVNSNVTFYDVKSPQGGNYWQTAASMRPNRVTPLIPLSYIDPNALAANDLMSVNGNIFNGCFLAGTQNDMTNVFADYYAAGKSRFTSRQFQFDAGINIDLGKLLDGLSFHTQMSVDYATSYNTSYNNNYATYEPIWSTANGKDVIVGLNKFGEDKKSGVQNIGGSADNQTIAFNAHFDYLKTFNDVHNVSAMVLASGYQQSYTEKYHRTSSANLGFLASYNYDHRYFAEFAGSAIHSARFAKSNRNAFSPTVTLGWKLIADSWSFFDDLTLSASAGVLNTDMGIDDFYMYSSVYTQSEGAWWSFIDGGSLRSTQSVQGENKNLGFLKRKEVNFNIHANMFDQALNWDLSFFHNTMEGGIIRGSSLFPSYFSVGWPNSSFVPYLNYNDDKRYGVDFSVNYKKQLGEVFVQAGVNGTWYKTEASKRDDSMFEDEYQHRQGRDLDANWGYECMGIFQSQEEIDAAPSQAKLAGADAVKPGDLRYRDINGDGVIDTKDQVALSRGGWYGAPFTLGVNLTAKYKNFTLFVLGTGGFGAKAFKSNSYWWVKGEDKYSAVVRDRWTPETAATATYPRLTTKNGDNNFVNSSFWEYSTNQFNVAKVQLTYDVPQSLLGNGIIKGVSAYVSGSNLLTIAKEREILEMNVGSAPQSRFYNLGVKLTF